MEIIKVADVGRDASSAKAADVIARGGIVVYPTDTLYGLGVNALNGEALARLRALKGREKKKPVSLLFPSLQAIEDHFILEGPARAIAEKHFPGALTLVLPAKAHLPAEIQLNGAVGVRIPADEFSHTLSVMSEFPVTATSANLSGLQTPATVPEIIRHFGPKIAEIDLFVDDGPRAGGTPSTVVAVMDGVPRILREGAIGREELGL